MTVFTTFDPARGRHALAVVVLAACSGSGSVVAADAAAARSCSATSGDRATPVIELYTSEGCSSCPAADRWLSALKADPKAVALAFHVDYWDRLGWKDRFASAAWTARQQDQQRVNGARFSYTPQVVVDGRDRPDWNRLAPTSALTSTSTGAASPIDLRLERRDDRIVARVTSRPGAASPAPARLAAYWAVTENAHTTTVKAGENDGATLHHDFVVREMTPVPAWSTATDGGAHTLERGLPRGEAGHPAAVNLIVVDAASGRPVQALKLTCP